MTRCSSPRPWLQSLRAREPGHRAQSARIRSARRSHQDLPAHARESLPIRTLDLRDRLRRVGARFRPSSQRALHRDGARRRHRRADRAKRLERAVRQRHRVLRSGRATDRLDRRPHGVLRAKRKPGRALRPRAGSHPFGADRSRSRALRGPAGEDRSATARQSARKEVTTPRAFAIKAYTEAEETRVW